jgi:hypothetical protein
VVMAKLVQSYRAVAWLWQRASESNTVMAPKLLCHACVCHTPGI